MTARVADHTPGAGTARQLDLTSGWHGSCPCGWVGRERRSFVVAEADSRLHALERFYGETPTPGVNR